MNGLQGELREILLRIILHDDLSEGRPLTAASNSHVPTSSHQVLLLRGIDPFRTY